MARDAPPGFESRNPQQSREVAVGPATGALVSQVELVQQQQAAAAVGVRLIVDRPVWTLETNIHGTEVVLHECARDQTPVFVASSSEVYGKGSACPFREEDDVVLGPTTKSRWSYAASKMALEALSDAMRRELRLFGVHLAIVRPGAIKTELYDDIHHVKNAVEDSRFAKFFDRYAAGVARMAPKHPSTPEQVAALVYKAATDPRKEIMYCINNGLALKVLGYMHNFGVRNGAIVFAGDLDALARRAQPVEDGLFRLSCPSEAPATLWVLRLVPAASAEEANGRVLGRFLRDALVREVTRRASTA